MARRSTVMIVTGPAGSGKTYRRASVFLYNEFLQMEEGVHISNFPLKLDAIEEALVKNHGWAAGQLEKRVKLIPEAELTKWLKGTSGPWEYFRETDLEGAHVAIDEIHNFCGSNSSPAIKRQWQEWLGELRHRGATIEFLSQHPLKVAKEINQECEIKIGLVNGETKRDPWFGISFADWYELRAGLTREYNQAIYEVEERVTNGKWKVSDIRTYWINPAYFQFYDSFSAPIKGGKKAEGHQREYQKRNLLSLGWWFYSRNMFRVTSRLLLVVAFFLFMFNGKYVMMQFMKIFTPKAQVQPAQPEPVKPAKKVEVVYNENTPYPTTRPASPATMPSEREMELQRQLDEQQTRAKAAEDELRREKLKQSEITAMTENTVMFGDGQVVAVGEMVIGGMLDGKVLESIDLRRRLITLDDGTVFRMRSVTGVSVGGVMRRVKEEVKDKMNGAAK